MSEQITKYANCNYVANVLTRKEQAVQDAIASGQNIESVIKREQAIEQAEYERKMRLLEYAS